MIEKNSGFDPESSRFMEAHEQALNQTCDAISSAQHGIFALIRNGATRAHDIAGKVMATPFRHLAADGTMFIDSGLEKSEYDKNPITRWVGRQMFEFGVALRTAANRFGDGVERNPELIGTTALLATGAAACSPSAEAPPPAYVINVDENGREIEQATPEGSLAGHLNEESGEESGDGAEEATADEAEVVEEKVQESAEEAEPEPSPTPELVGVESESGWKPPTLKEAVISQEATGGALPDSVKAMLDRAIETSGNSGFDVVVEPVPNDQQGDLYRVAFRFRLPNGNYIAPDDIAFPSRLNPDGSVIEDVSYSEVENSADSWISWGTGLGGEEGVEPTMVLGNVTLPSGEQAAMTYRNPVSGEWTAISGHNTVEDLIIVGDNIFQFSSEDGSVSAVGDIPGLEGVRVAENGQIFATNGEGIEHVLEEGKFVEVATMWDERVNNETGKSEVYAGEANEWSPVEQNYMGEEYVVVDGVVYVRGGVEESVDEVVELVREEQQDEGVEEAMEESESEWVVAEYDDPGIQAAFDNGEIEAHHMTQIEVGSGENKQLVMAVSDSEGNNVATIRRDTGKWMRTRYDVPDVNYIRDVKFLNIKPVTSMDRLEGDELLAVLESAPALNLQTEDHGKAHEVTFNAVLVGKVEHDIRSANADASFTELEIAYKDGGDTIVVSMIAKTPILFQDLTKSSSPVRNIKPEYSRLPVSLGDVLTIYSYASSGDSNASFYGVLVPIYEGAQGSVSEALYPDVVVGIASIDELHNQLANDGGLINGFSEENGMIPVDRIDIVR